MFGNLARFAGLASLPLFLAVPGSAAAPWVFGKLPMVAQPLDSALAHTWDGIRKRNIQPWSDGLVHRPKSETPGDAVSEGQAYGMIVALYENDQATFNKIWDAAESKLWNDGNAYYDWRYENGRITGSGLATDADQDIALMLIFADALVKKGIWTEHQSPKNATYSARAQSILNTLWSKGINDGNLRPGANWGGGGTCSNGAGSWNCGDHVNPGYFSPANYRIFKDFDPSHAWGDVVEKSYTTIQKSPGYGKGLLPDWMNLDGSYPTSSALGYNPFYGGKALYKDAIRVHWRLAMDWMWFQEPRAKTFLENAAKFIGSPDKANFYTMEGSLVPAESTFTLSGEKGPSRSRREHSALTVGMWACAFLPRGTEAAEPWAKELLSFHGEGTDVWGLSRDPLGGQEDTAHNEIYFDQFLAWFGASSLAGRFTNVLADLNASDAATVQAWKNRPFVAFPTGNGAGAPMLTATLVKPGAWAVRMIDTASGKEWSTTGVSGSIEILVSELVGSDPLPTGTVQYEFRARGLKDTVLFERGITAVDRFRPRSGPSWIANGGRLDVEVRSGALLTLRHPDGRVLAQVRAETGSTSLRVPTSGLVLLEVSNDRESTVHRVLLLP
ncbi:MAG: hypothetical protein H6686_11590 [Fibrobacteria bacterium]|nr:hypothetical protein [Fibrobacteria bacterium]